MSNYFSDDIISEVAARIDIVDLIAETTPVSRKGNNFWALCPFHQEKTPSLSISRDKQFFYCFGCHTGGNVFTFVMQKEGLTFPEALEKLAAKAGVSLPEKSGIRTDDKRQILYDINEWASTYFQQQLLTPAGEQARLYLHKRGITQDTVKRFQLGYAGKQWQGLSDFLIAKGMPADSVVQSGLLKKSNQSDKYFDLFRERLIFPIITNHPVPVAFGGRSLGESMPKYLNSPESPLFSKRRQLYGLNLARPYIREENEAILVEGYMDCIKMHQYGFTNTVAALGTAFTPEQAALLHRYTENVLVLYDGDTAGQRETLRAIDLLMQEGLKANTVTLPNNMDPDDMLNTNGTAGMKKFLQANRISGLEFKLEYFLAESVILNLPRQVEIIERLYSDFSQLQSVIEQDSFIDLLVRKLKTPELTVRKELKRLSRAQSNPLCFCPPKEKYSITEKIIAAMLANNSVFAQIKAELGLNIFIDEAEQELILAAEQLLLQSDCDLPAMLKIQSSGKIWEPLLARLITAIEHGHTAQKSLIDKFIYEIQDAQKKHAREKIIRSINLLEKQGDFKEILNYIIKLHEYATR